MIPLAVLTVFVVYIVGSIWWNGDFKGETLGMCIGIVLVSVLARPMFMILRPPILEFFVSLWIRMRKASAR